MSSKYLLVLPVALHRQIKQEARKHSITMNEYIVTVLEQFMSIQAGNRNDVERTGSKAVEN